MLSHFSAVILFSLFVSVVFGITQRSQPRQMLIYGARCFGLFALSAIVLSWLMMLLHR
jgi:hypothetical protein